MDMKTAKVAESQTSTRSTTDVAAGQRTSYCSRVSRLSTTTAHQSRTGGRWRESTLGRCGGPVECIVRPLAVYIWSLLPRCRNFTTHGAPPPPPAQRRFKWPILRAIGRKSADLPATTTLPDALVKASDECGARLQPARHPPATTNRLASLKILLAIHTTTTTRNKERKWRRYDRVVPISC